ncbi:MAG: hypothetical protein ACTSPY_02600 [Candidatus Helarchaeota archaeon]
MQEPVSIGFDIFTDRIIPSRSASYSVPIRNSFSAIILPSESRITACALHENQLSQDRITISKILRSFSSNAINYHLTFKF